MPARTTAPVGRRAETGLTSPHRVAPVTYSAVFATRDGRPAAVSPHTVAMRAMAVAFVLVLSTSTARAVPELHVAASVSAQHTSVEKDDGAPSGWGPRWELSAGLGLAGWI